MPSYARETILFSSAEGPPVSVNGRVDSEVIMMGGGGSREASGGDGRDDVQSDEDVITCAQDSVPIPPILSLGSKCYKGNLTVLRRILYLDLAKGNPKRTL
jgi:hypothetical protein